MSRSSTPRLLALDLDGTLLRKDHTIADEDLKAIARVRALGVTVTIATGRLYTGALAAARACEIEGAIACMEGSHIVDADGGVTHAEHRFDDSAALREALSDHGLAHFVFESEGIHHDSAGAPFADYVRTWSPRLRVVDDALAHPAWPASPMAVVSIGERDRAAAVASALRENSAWRVARFPVATAAGIDAVLVRRAGPDKGTALRELCSRAGCTVADAVAVGDWINDVPMLTVAGRSFAMAGAPPDVARAASDRLTRVAGTGGGVAEAVERVWGRG